MKIGERINRHGVVVAMMVCEMCGEEFELTPGHDVEGPGWENCLAPTCKSYEIERDPFAVVYDPSEAPELDRPRTGGVN